MKIRITKKRDKNGIRGSSYRCPIALAITRKCGNIPCVSDDTANFKGEDHALPRNVKEFIFAFDRGHAVHPIVFELQ